MEVETSFRSRLIRFYSKNNPVKLATVDDLLSKYKGDEEDLIQKMHLKYGVRDIVSNVAIDELYENERYSFVNRTFGSTFLTFPGHLMVVDRKRWSTAIGSPSSQEMNEVEPTLPDGYEWTGPWEIDSTYVKCDRDGWTYAFDFSNFTTMLAQDESYDTPGMTDYVRRRRWIRPRRRKQVTPPSPESETSSTSDSDCMESPKEDVVDDESPPTSVYRFFNPSMSMEEHNNSWTLHLQALDNLHRKINHTRAAQLLEWKKRKAQLRAAVESMSIEKESRDDRKIDQLKRNIWFPIEKGYIWRASLSGLFLGVHEFWIENFISPFSISLHSSSTFQLIFHGDLRGRFDHVKVKGDKGTRIPNAKWNQLSIDVSFHGTWILQHIKGEWVFLVDQSKSLEFSKMNMLYKGGGLGVPDALVQLILNDVVTNFIRDRFILSLPVELATLVQTTSSCMEIGGEMVLDGLNISITVDGSFHKSTQVDESNQLQQVLGLTRSQLNLLLSTRQYSGIDMLFPSLAQCTKYLRQYALDPKENESNTLYVDWMVTWDRILELLLIQRRHLHPRGNMDVDPIDFQSFLSHVKHHALEKCFPVRIHLTKLDCHLHVASTLDAFGAWLTQATRVAAVATSIGASVMGIRIGRKDRSSKLKSTTQETSMPPAMTDLLRFVQYGKEWINTGFLRHFHANIDGKLTGKPHESDALIRMQATDIEIQVAGPFNSTCSLDWVLDFGRVVCQTIKGTDGEQGIQIEFKTNTGISTATATLNDIQSSLHVDPSKLTEKSKIFTIQYGSNNAITSQWHSALETNFSIGFSTVLFHVGGILKFLLNFLQQNKTLHEKTFKWLEKLILTHLKYCDSDTLLIAWNISIKMDQNGILNIETMKNHPQPFLYYDQISLLNFLDDMEKIFQLI